MIFFIFGVLLAVGGIATFIYFQQEGEFHAVAITVVTTIGILLLLLLGRTLYKSDWLKTCDKHCDNRIVRVIDKMNDTCKIDHIEWKSPEEIDNPCYECLVDTNQKGE